MQGRAYIVVTDTSGRQVVNTFVAYGQQPEFTGDPQTIQSMLAHPLPVVSNLFVSLVVKEPVFNISVPVMSEGKVRLIFSTSTSYRFVLADAWHV